MANANRLEKGFMDKRPVIVFATSLPERDYLRSLFPSSNSGVLTFEKEGICFDNLRSVNPRAIIVRTDARAVAWRFVFATHALKATARLIMLSNELDGSQFNLYGLNGQVKWLTCRYGDNGFLQTFGRTLSSEIDTEAPTSSNLFVGETEAVQRINAMLPSLRQANDPVLITGEAGTGKEHLARLIAGGSPETLMFVKIDCAALQSEKAAPCKPLERSPDASFVKTLDRFGASSSRATILLDKIDRLGRDAQGEMLMLLENHSSGCVDHSARTVRFIATTDADLQHLVNCNGFRKELFYRLNVIPVHLPPLRERAGDIPLLSDYLSICACDAMQQGFMFLKEKAMERLRAHPWPGNIDELESVIRRFITSGEEREIPGFGDTPAPGPKSRENLLYQAMVAETEPNFLEIRSCLPVLGDFSLKHICEKFAFQTEKRLMQKALETTNWNRKKAAALLNISYKSMLNKMKLYEIV